MSCTQLPMRMRCTGRGREAGCREPIEWLASGTAARPHMDASACAAPRHATLRPGGTAYRRRATVLLINRAARRVAPSRGHLLACHQLAVTCAPVYVVASRRRSSSSLCSTMTPLPSIVRASRRRPSTARAPSRPLRRVLCPLARRRRPPTPCVAERASCLPTVLRPLAGRRVASRGPHKGSRRVLCAFV